MEWFISNWYVILAILIVGIMVVTGVVYFFKLPTAKQVESFKEWLRYAVAIAEKDLGSGTGQLKLRKVYDMAISKFSWIATIYSFEQFSELVDTALEWMEEQLAENKNIEKIVKGE